MKKILIFGSTGSLGTLLAKNLKKNYIVFTDQKIKKKLKSSSDYKVLYKIISKKKPNYIINLIALTNVDKCEKKKFLADKSNFVFVKNLTKSISMIKNKIRLIHISTDQVYNGRGKHDEKHVQPINYYGLSKLKGERAIKKIPSIILRTNFFGKTKKKENLCNWIFKNVKNKKKINTFKNIYFSPLHITTLIKIINKILKHNSAQGVFNLGTKNKISKAKFAENFIKDLGLDMNLLNKTNYSNNHLYAKRPLDMSMKINKFEKYFKIKLPTVKTEMSKLIKEYK